MMKAIEENKLTVVIKRLLWEFDLHCKFMCTGENNDKKKEQKNFCPLLLQL